jgi:2'-5' RNA ligase
MSLLRAFIALEFPASMQDAIQKQTARLRETLGENLVRWVPAGNLHLTLKFIGEVPETHLDFLKQMLAHEAQAHAGFDLNIAGLGGFPNLEQPRVLWLGVQAPVTLLSLQNAIEAAVTRLGHPKEQRAFSPHLTIGRAGQGLHMTDLQKISRCLASVQLGNIAPVRVDSVHLFRSDLKPSGPIHTKLFDAKLKTVSATETQFQKR